MMVSEFVAETGFHLSLSPILLLVIFGLVTSFSLIVSFLLEYHWKTYGIRPSEVLQIRFWYWSGFIAMSGLMLASAILYPLL